MSVDRKIPLIDDQWEIGVDTKKVLHAIGDSLFELGDFKVGSFLKKLGKAAQQVETLPDLAFELVFTSLHKACKELTLKNAPEAIEKKTQLGSHVAFFKSDTRKKIGALQAGIDESFFDYPAAWSFLKVFEPQFSLWLMEGLEINPVTAQVIVKELPTRFWVELIWEWDNKPLKYQPLQKFFSNNPFATNLKLHNRRRDYYKEIAAHYHQSIMNEDSVKLSDLYLKPRFKIYKRLLPKGDYESDRDGFVSLKFDGENIHDYICHYFFQNKRAFKNSKLDAESSRLLFLLGQPGQGKTSFTYRVIHDALQQENRKGEIAFVKLNRLKNPGQFIKTPFGELKEYFEKEQFDFDSGLLILDGLDEVYMSAGLTKAEINDFLNSLSEELRTRPELRIILTSRFHYIDLSHLKKDQALVLSLDTLTLGQQADWLKKYRALFPETKLTVDDLTEIHNGREGKFKALWELVNQPILLQLIAKADFEVKEVNNRGEIYERLFNTLIDRSWEDGQLKKFDIEPDEFREYIRALAHKIYQSDREFITMSELEKWKVTKNLIGATLKEAQAKEQSIGEALKDVLITFYFQPVEDEEERAKYDEDKKTYAIEFFHKSLQEYLAMEHIYYSLKEDLLDTKKRDRFVIDDGANALKIIWKLTVPKGLTQETSAYLREIVKNDADIKGKEKLCHRLLYFMPEFFEYQFIDRYDNEKPLTRLIDAGLDCFYVIWSIYSLLGNKLKVEILEDWKNSLIRVIAYHQRYRPDRLHLAGADLAGADLAGADLAGASLGRADLFRADLGGADLGRADLGRANLGRADLFRADLGEADLFRANLGEADLFRANLVGANLGEANLFEANLGEANLGGANGLTVQQLQKVYSLYRVRDLDLSLKEELKETGFGHLFDEPNE